MRKVLIGFAAALAAMGCSSPGTLVERHEPDGVLATRVVDQPGIYGLFVAGEDDPMWKFALKSGEKLGFEGETRATKDHFEIHWIYGVAGSKRGLVDSRQTYEWRRIGDTPG